LLSWRWVFFINVPIAMAALVLVPRLVPESASTQQRHLDVLGALLATGGLSLSALGMLERANHAWSEPWTWLPLAAGALLIALFLRMEGHIEQPLVPLAFFRSTRRSIGNLALATFSAALAVLFFSVPLFLQQVLHYSPLLTGLAFLPVGPTFALAAAWSPNMVRRLGFDPAFDQAVVPALQLVVHEQADEFELPELLSSRLLRSQRKGVGRLTASYEPV
ncbi:MAG: MFS transporter, partial [bacterium]|nr:MFS transporter [bacterium]